MKRKETYEIMDASMVGLKDNSLVLGKHSGRHAFKSRLMELGFVLSEDDLEKAFVRFKALADKKKDILEEDLESIVADEIYQMPDTYQLKYVQVVAGNTTKPTAVVQLMKGEEILESAQIGTGPVDAIYKTIDFLVSETVNLKDFTIQSVTQGTDALGVVSVKIMDQGRTFSGRGSSTDVLVSSAKAYIMAINRMLYARGQHKIFVQS